MLFIMVTKIKDGFFISDLEGAQDGDFIELNKITRIINTAGTQVPNIFAHHGIRYLTLNWVMERIIRLLIPRPHFIFSRLLPL